MTNYPLNFTAQHLYCEIGVNLVEINDTEVMMTQTILTPEGEVFQSVMLKTEVEDWLINSPEAFAEV